MSFFFSKNTPGGVNENALAALSTNMAAAWLATQRHGAANWEHCQKPIRRRFL